MRRRNALRRRPLDALLAVLELRPAGLPPIETLDGDAEGRAHIEERAAEALAHQVDADAREVR